MTVLTKSNNKFLEQFSNFVRYHILFCEWLLNVSILKVLYKINGIFEIYQSMVLGIGVLQFPAPDSGWVGRRLKESKTGLP